MQVRDAGSTTQLRQRRYVAVLYADLCRSTELAASMEAEVYADLLDVLRDVYRSIIPKHGGTLLQIHGDGHLAMFGYPGAGEEDVRLAVNAALEIHQVVRELQLDIHDLPSNLNLRLHSGVQAGLVLVQEGDVYDGSYQLRGDTTNICARLSAAAGEDEILVGADSLLGSEPFFKYGKQRTLQLKGIVDPVIAFPVVGTTDLSTRYQARRHRSRLPFMGRNLEHEIIEAHWQRVCSGEPQVVYIAGPPGVGKTRLADEFFSTVEMRGTVVMRCSCETLSSAQPLDPFIQMIKAAINQESQLGIAFAKDDALQIALSQYAQDATMLDGLIAALTDCMAFLCRHAPMVLFVDDWHWADESSRRLVAQLATRNDLPLLFVLTTRVVDAGESSMLLASSVIQLDGLEGADLSKAISTLFPEADPFACRNIETVSGGNPLFLEELSHASGLDRFEPVASPVEHVPQWLYSLVQFRVGQLTEREQQIVQVAAVIGHSSPLWLLQQVAEFNGVELLTGATVLDLLFPRDQSGEWYFKHGLTRAIVYDLIGLRRRQTLHRTIAQALVKDGAEGDHSAEALAYHFAGAGMRDEAVQYATEAGERAMSIPALDIARVQYRQAIELLCEGELTEAVYQQVLALAKRLSLVVLFDPSTEEVPIFSQILGMAEARGDGPAQAIANFWVGRIHYGLGKPRRALHYYYQARTLAQACGHAKLVGELDSNLGLASASNCEHKASIALLQKTLQSTPDVKPYSVQASGKAYVLGSLGMVYGDRGEFDAALECFSQAQALKLAPRDPTEANVLSKLTAVYLWQEEWAQAITTSEKVMRISEQIRNHYLFGMSRMLHAYGRWRLDGDRAHVETMRESTRWLETSYLDQYLSLNYGWLAEISAELGEYEDVRHYAAKAMRRARAGDGYGLACAARALCIAAQHQSWTHDSEYYLLIAQRSAAQRGSAREHALNQICAERTMTSEGVLSHP